MPINRAIAPYVHAVVILEHDPKKWHGLTNQADEINLSEPHFILTAPFIRHIAKAISDTARSGLRDSLYSPGDPRGSRGRTWGGPHGDGD